MNARVRTVPIFAYHRVGEPQGDHVPTVTPETFEWQLQFLQRHHYQVIDLGQFVEQRLHETSDQRRYVVITFDDGYAETFSVAAPLLRRFGCRAIVFVTPAEVGLPGFMTWEQLRAVTQAGITIGSHTMYHTYLPLISRDKVEHELVESKRTLEQRLGRPITWLSYPVGGYTPEVQAVAKTAGYQGACTTNRGVSKRADDLFALRRIKITERDRNPVAFWVKLSGYYDLFRRLESPA